MKRQDVLDRIASDSPQLTIGTLTTEDQAEAATILKDGKINLLHVDIMDGKVWPKTTVGPDFVAKLDTELVKDVHLLVEKPEEQIASFAEAGAGSISFSVEYTDDIGGVLSLIEEKGAQILRGVSLNPSTSLDVIKPYLDQIDFVVLLTIGPDSAKQTYFNLLPEKIEKLRAWKPELRIVVDGAIKKENVGEVAAMGPDWIATGSAVFDGVNPAENITFMKSAMEDALKAKKNA